MATKNPVQVIEGELLDVQKQQAELEQLQEALSENPQFVRFLELNKAVSTGMAKVREHIEDVMIPAYKEGKIDKSLKFEGGSVTVTERNDFEVDEAELPPKFFKRVVNTTLIRKTFELEHKAPKGCVPVKKYGIMIKLR